MLKLAGESDIGLEKIEQITYVPGLKDTGDLEAGTKTITATTKPGTADYSAALTLPKPGDARLVIKRIAARLQVTRDSGTSTNLYCTVSVDSADGSTNLLFDAVDVQANNLQATDLTSGTVFDLLSDGQAHTFYFFFWVDSGDSVISLVQLWEGVGTKSSVVRVLDISHSGWIELNVLSARQGTGSRKIWLYDNSMNYSALGKVGATTDANIASHGLISDMTIALGTTVSTDLVYIDKILAVLRSEQ